MTTLLWYLAIGVAISSAFAFSNVKFERSGRWRKETPVFLLGVHSAIAVFWPVAFVWFCVEFYRLVRRRA